MNAVRAMIPACAKRSATAPIRRMFSSRSAGPKPSPKRVAKASSWRWRRSAGAALSPRRTLSPSRTKLLNPRAWRRRSTALASVLLPQPDSPVNQSTHPRCPANRSRSSRLTACWCHRTSMCSSDMRSFHPLFFRGDQFQPSRTTVAVNRCGTLPATARSISISIESPGP